jgi:hypothetical protein
MKTNVFFGLVILFIGIVGMYLHANEKLAPTLELITSHQENVPVTFSKTIGALLFVIVAMNLLPEKTSEYILAILILTVSFYIVRNPGMLERVSTDLNKTKPVVRN